MESAPKMSLDEAVSGADDDDPTIGPHFFHVGWMKRYQGADDDDPTIGPHGHLQDNRFGHECFNFFPRNGSCYGYVPTGVDISNLGASRSAKFVDDVVCVWVAKDPERDARVIVGWYKGGCVFRSSGHLVKPSGNKFHQQDIEYRASAPEASCTLIPVPRRTFEIPTRHSLEGGLGQSTVWYGGNAKFRKRVWKYINNWEERKKAKNPRSTSRANAGGGRNTDTELRKQIETCAVKFATNFFCSEDGGSYKVASKEKDNLGWDIEAKHPDKATLLVEVKGLSGDRVSVELTPNEYKQMMLKKNRNRYVLFVVTNCLGKRPLAHDYRFKNGLWSDVDGTVLEIQERTGAVCRSKR